MKPLMNLMNLYEAVWGALWLFEKIRDIFFINGYGMWKMGSLMFIRFINLAMRSKKGEFVRQVTNINNYLMNLMNVCVVRVFNKIFENVVWMDVELMKWKCSVSAFRYINLKA